MGVILFLAWPMLFTSAGMAQDWVNHLWDVWRQSVMISRDYRPSLFLNDGGSVFYPLFIFYGGTLYSLGGVLAMLLGGAPVKAYVLSYLIGLTAAYGGWYWLGRMAGLGRWVAHVPGMLFVTSGYYLTLIYARGDWPELMAVSAIPLLAASGLSVLRADRLRLLPALALGGSALVFFGSHNLTMLWGSTALVLFALVTVIAVPPVRILILPRNVLRVACIVIPSALVNAWYLLPDLAYSQRTVIAQDYDFSGVLRNTQFVVSAGHLFTFSRATTAPNTPDFVLALPVLAIVWVVAGIAISLALPTGGAWRRLLWIASAFSMLFAILMTHPNVILDLPRPYTLLQFTYRLETYVLLGLCAAVLTTLVLLRHWPQPLRRGVWVGLVAVLLAMGVGAIQQVDGYPKAASRRYPVVVPDRNVVFAPDNQPPTTASQLGWFDDTSLPLVNPAGAPLIEFPSSAIRDQLVTVPVNLPAGEQIRTNLTGAPYVVSVTGARVIGRDSNGRMVLQILATKGTGIKRISLGPSRRLPVVLGEVISLLALTFLGLSLLILIAQRVRVKSTKGRPQAHDDDRLVPPIG